MARIPTPRHFKPVGDASNLHSVNVKQGAGRTGLDVVEHYQKPSNWAWRGARETRVTHSDPMGRHPHTQLSTALKGGLTKKGKVAVSGAGVTAYGGLMYADNKSQKKSKSKVKKSMSVSIWGVDHNDEIAKFNFKPVLGPKPPMAPKVPGVANGLKQVGGLAKPKAAPVGRSQAQFGPAASRIGARSRFNAGQQSALGQRLGVRKSMESDMGVSVWGVDHGPDEVAKAKTDQPGSTGNGSVGRHVTSQFFTGWHGAVAGRKGKKLRAAGSELGGSLAGSAAGGLVMAATKGRAQVAPGIGNIAGTYYGTRHANRKGYYKAES